jgi:hypothetical protein
MNETCCQTRRDRKEKEMTDHKEAVVETKYGKIEGDFRDGIYIFKGIPYAAPPLGEFRWGVGDVHKQISIFVDLFKVPCVKLFRKLSIEKYKELKEV